MSKADTTSSPKSKSLTAEEKATINSEFLGKWNELKEGIIKGGLSTEQLKENAKQLYDFRMKVGIDSGAVVNQMVKDCTNANISKENVHKFVSALLNVELDVEKRKPNSEGLMRQSGTTLAASFLTLEHKINNFGQNLAEIVKSGDEKKLISAFTNVEIPAYLKDHYKPIMEHYSQSPKTIQEAYQSIIFNALSTNVNIILQQRVSDIPKEQRDSPEAAKISSEVRKELQLVKKVSEVIYPNSMLLYKGGFKDIPEFTDDKIYDALKAQMRGEKPSKEMIEQLEKNANKRYDIYTAKKEADKQVQTDKSEPLKSNSKGFTQKIREVPQKIKEVFLELKREADKVKDLPTELSKEINSIKVEIEKNKNFQKVKEGVESLKEKMKYKEIPTKIKEGIENLKKEIKKTEIFQKLNKSIEKPKTQIENATENSQKLKQEITDFNHGTSNNKGNSLNDDRKVKFADNVLIKEQSQKLKQENFPKKSSNITFPPKVLNEASAIKTNLYNNLEKNGNTTKHTSENQDKSIQTKTYNNKWLSVKPQSKGGR